MVLDFLAVDNFDFTRKIVKKNLGEKFVKMLGFVKIEFLDKNLTFRIVCEGYYLQNLLLDNCDFAIFFKKIRRGPMFEVPNHKLLEEICL